MSWGLYFYFYEKAKLRYRVMEGHALASPSTLTFVHHVAAALQASAVTVMFTNPLWLVKTRLQLQLSHSHGHYTGMMHALRTIVATDGVAGLYRGLVPALALTSHGAVQFAAYEEMKQLCGAYGVVPVRVLVGGDGRTTLFATAVCHCPVVRGCRCRCKLPSCHVVSCVCGRCPCPAVARPHSSRQHHSTRLTHALSGAVL